MNDKDPLIFIEHILNNIKDIEKFSKRLKKEDLRKNILKQKAIIKSIEIIGEAVSNLSSEFKNKYSKIPWRDVIGMRNKLIHQYFGIDLEIVWKTIKEDVPELKKQINEIKEDLIAQKKRIEDEKNKK